MNSEKMNPEGELPQNDNENENDMNNNNSQNDEPFNSVNGLTGANRFNCCHVLIALIINLCLLLIGVTEFFFKKEQEIFNYIVDTFIFLVFIFVISFFITKKENYLNGFVYYPFCSLFWGLADFLTIFYVEKPHDWGDTDTIKLVKFSLIGLSLLINVGYMKCCCKKEV